MDIKHVVWDWNCTLLDDFAISVEAASAACAAVDGGPVGADDYRAHFTRPVRAFYNSLLSREVSDEEWRIIAARYHHEYRNRLPGVRLRKDAVEALTAARNRGLSQSLLSMGVQDEVAAMVDRLGIGPFFDLVEGTDVARRTDGKAQMLEIHLEKVFAGPARRPPPTQVLLVGDTQDDAEAALAAGLRCALLTDGCFDPSIMGSPLLTLVESLVAAVSPGLSGVRY